MSSDAGGPRRSNRSHATSQPTTNPHKPELPSAPTNSRDTPSADNQAQSNVSAGDNSQNNTAPNIDEDDMCPVCQSLFYEPVITQCGHILCKACMEQWAQVSSTSHMAAVDIDEEIPELRSSRSTNLSSSGITNNTASTTTEISVKCPMCRTQTSATPDRDRERQLNARYRIEYAQRRIEDEAEKAAAASGLRSHGTQNIVLYVGNYHREVAPTVEDRHNTHEWTFFVRMSRSDIIEEVQLLLHPTFRPPRVIRTRPPYSIRRRGWGIFTITAYIILKAGYAWLSSEAENSPDGAVNGMIGLPWTLDFEGFDGRGSMERMTSAVRRDGGETRSERTRDSARSQIGDYGTDDDQDEDEDEEDEELRRDNRAWERMVRDYQRDGRWEPDEMED